MKTVGCFCVYTRDCPPGNGVELAKCGGTQGCPSQRKYKAGGTLQRAQRGTVQTQLKWQTVKAMRHTSFTPSSPTHNGSPTWIQRTKEALKHQAVPPRTHSCWPGCIPGNTHPCPNYQWPAKTIWQKVYLKK